MGIYIKKEQLEALREKYPKGCRVELVKMDDPYREMPPGLKGVVTGIDRGGTAAAVCFLPEGIPFHDSGRVC